MLKIICNIISIGLFIVDVRLGSKHAFGISSTAEKVYRMSIFIEYRKPTLPK